MLVLPTGVLRNLAVAPAHAPGFVAGGALPALRAAASVLPGQQELVLNVGRVLSKLSLSDACVVGVAQCSGWLLVFISKLDMAASLP